MRSFENYISIGYFCSIARDLESLGLRSESMPFDWCISDFEGIMRVIKDGFAEGGMLNYEWMYQKSDRPSVYKNQEYGIAFYHDFNEYEPLSAQLAEVTAKYEKRLLRFFQRIKEPSLLIRYISSEILTEEGRPLELVWIEEHFSEIISIIKGHNPENEILFIANEGVTSDIIKIYHVDRDENDQVARQPLRKHKVLADYFSTVDFPQREENLIYFEKKQRIKKKKSSLYSRICRKIYRYTHKLYVHEKTYQ